MHVEGQTGKVLHSRSYNSNQDNQTLVAIKLTHFLPFSGCVLQVALSISGHTFPILKLVNIFFIPASVRIKYMHSKYICILKLI